VGGLASPQRLGDRDGLLLGELALDAIGQALPFPDERLRGEPGRLLVDAAVRVDVQDGVRARDPQRDPAVDAGVVLLGALATIGFAVWLGRRYARANR
jgi:hypothetical protein